MALLSALFLFGPGLINTESYKKKILTDIFREVNGEAQFQKIDFSFFPWPHLRIYQGSLSIPGKAEAVFESMSIFPEIFPLFKGEVRASKILISTPFVTIYMPKRNARESEGRDLSAFTAEGGTVISWLGFFSSRTPGLILVVENGRLNLKKGRKPGIWIEDIQLQIEFPPEEFKVDLSCRSSFWKSVSLSGNLQMDRSTPRVRLELQGKDVDVDSTRQAVLAALGDIPGIQKIFGVLKGGRLPEVSFHSRGNSLEDLVKLENLFIKGRLIDGRAWVPKVDLNLEGVTGEVVISGGVLEGEKLAARLGSSTGRSGRLKLGLSGENAPFHLDMAIDADLAQIPLILKRLRKNGPFAKEIDLLDDLRGNATGKLVLNGSTELVEIMLAVSEFNLSARYQRIPYPLKVHGGRFFYDKDRVVFKDLAGYLGGTSFSGLSAWVDMGRTPHMVVKSGASEIVLAEIYPWLLSFEKLKDAFKNYDAASGRIKLSFLDLKGPLFDPGRWQFQLDGEVHDLAVNTSLLKGRVEVSRGEFSAIPETLSFKSVQSRILDASINGSGVINGYLEGLQKADVTLQGSMGSEMIKKISNLINLPSELDIRSPISVSNAHLIWDRNGKTAFTGSLAVKEGPDISIEMFLDSGELMIKHLLVQDKVSRAVVALAFSNNALGLDFKGNLDKSTLDGLLTKNQFLTGWIKGDFKARILMDQPLQSRIWGSLQGEGFVHPWKSKMPIRIESVSLDSTENRLEVESALLTWGENRLALSGTLNASAEGPRIDLNLWANAIEWDKIEKLLRKKESKERNSQAEKSAWDLPLRGNLRVESESFKYGRFVWRPFIADVTFSRDGVGVNVAEANLCGISFPGTLKFTPPKIQLDFKSISMNQEIESALACLWNRKDIMSGRFDFDGALTAKGEKEALNQILRGDLKFNAYDGRIYRSSVLTKIFSLLNVSKIIRGDFSEFSKEGFAYESIKAGGEIKNGKLRLKEIILVSPSMNIVGEGEIDIIDKKVDIKLWVAPLKTVNFVISKIPGIRYLTGENLISIPMKVTGDVADPKVSLFSD